MSNPFYDVAEDSIILTNKNVATTRYCQPHFKIFHRNGDETYLCVDGFFSKKKFIDGVTSLNLHQIGKLRHDADMRYLYTGPKREKGSGNQKTYDGKVDWQDLSRFTYHHTQDDIALYSLVLNHKVFKRNLKVVVLVNEKIKKNYVILFATDNGLDPFRWVPYQ